MIISSILDEQWVVDGKVFSSRCYGDDAMYIKPLLNQKGIVPPGTNVLHSLVIDNNILSDLLENRKPENNAFLKRILMNNPIELNPVLALCEQRQKYSKASDALKEFADYLYKEFGHDVAAQNIDAFEASLSESRGKLIENAIIMSGYLSIIVYLYNQEWAAKEKLSCLSGMIEAANLPFYQVHFLFGALVFLVKESPHLFYDDDVKKVSEDMKIENSVDRQNKKIMSLSNDMMLPISAVFSAGTIGNTIVYPYIVTRDRLVQLFLSQISCGMLVEVGNGMKNGRWDPIKGRLLQTHLGQAIAEYTPHRHQAKVVDEIAVRRSLLKAFSETWVERSVALRK
jgi:hypothetical protein